MATVTLGHGQVGVINKPTTHNSPNGIAHSISDITGTDETRSTIKAERSAFKLDYADWLAEYKRSSSPDAYDGTFTSVDGSSSVNVAYADE